MKENVKWCQDLRSERSLRDKPSPCLNQVMGPLVHPLINPRMSPNTLNIVQEKAIPWRHVSGTHSVSGGGGWKGAQCTLDPSQSNQRPLQVPLSSLKE